MKSDAERKHKHKDQQDKVAERFQCHCSAHSRSVFRRRLRLSLGTLNQSAKEDRRMIKSSWFYVKFKYNEKVSPYVCGFFPGCINLLRLSWQISEHMILIVRENAGLFSSVWILCPDILYLLSVAD